MIQRLTTYPDTKPIAFCLALGTALATVFMQVPAWAGEADVVDGNISALGNNRYRIDATVLHADDGWDHYADRWDVLDSEGNVLGSRVLVHPHDNEQPFTRSLTLTLPPGTTLIRLRANDSVHGLGGTTIELSVPESS